MLKIDNNSYAFFVSNDVGAIVPFQEGKSCPKLSDAAKDAFIVKKGVPITLVSDVGEDLSVNITIPGGATIASSVTVRQTPATGYVFTTYSNETYATVVS